MIKGVNIHRYYTLPLADQLNLVADMGLTSIRVDIYNANSDTIAYLSNLKSASVNKGISVLPVVVPNAAASTTETTAYNWGKATANTLANAFPGMYWEAGNELDMFAIIPGKSGANTADYDTGRYNRCKGAIRGLYDGFQVDPNATVIVGIAGLHFGFLKRLKANNVNWDVTSEHFYVTPGSTDIVAGANLIFSTLASFGKPIAMTEYNQFRGHGLTSNATSLIEMMTVMDSLETQYNIIGSYIYELIDGPNLVLEEQTYGMANTSGVINNLGQAIKNVLNP